MFFRTANVLACGRTRIRATGVEREKRDPHKGEQMGPKGEINIPRNLEPPSNRKEKMAAT